MAKDFSVPPSRILRIENSVQSFFIDRGIWLFCSGIEAEMDESADKVKGAKQAGVARHQVLMKHLYPNNPEKRFRNPAVSSGGAEPAIGGENFFTGGKRRRG